MSLQTEPAPPAVDGFEFLDALPEETRVGNYFIANYPPFSTWTPEAVPRFEEALAEPASEGPLRLYVHLPFCARRCAYCYYRVHAGKRAREVELYLDSLLAEQSLYLRRPALAGRRLVSVYFGGGSPSFLTGAQLRRLLEGLARRLSWDDVEECVFECDPSQMTPGKFRGLRELGVTRVSLGFQSLTPRVLAACGRGSKRSHCLRAFGQARAAGFDEINVDLLAGLPGETEESWLETVETVAGLEPDCLSVYQLELSYNSLLHARAHAGGAGDLATWPAKRRWLDLAFRRFEADGCALIGGCMVVRDPRRYRFRYTAEGIWRGADLLALGESAFGLIRGVHYQNADSFEAYCGAVSEGKLPLRRARRMSWEEGLRREIVLQLRTGALDGAYFRAKFGVELQLRFPREIAALERRGLARVDGERLRLSREGLLRLDWLLPLFYLREHRGIRYT